MNIRVLYQKLLNRETEVIVQVYDNRPWDGYYLKIILKKRFSSQVEANEWYDKNAEDIRKVAEKMPK